MCVLAIIEDINRYRNGSGFGGQTVERTRIEYYPECPGCGRARDEGEKKCKFCDRSLVKKEEKISERKLQREDPSLSKRRKAGVYRSKQNPNVYVRVRVIHTPASRRTHSSCVRSACACAGGGRAGCSTKNFYNTKLKIRYFCNVKNNRK